LLLFLDFVASDMLLFKHRTNFIFVGQNKGKDLVALEEKLKRNQCQASTTS
jgi:hypothetical protein